MARGVVPWLGAVPVCVVEGKLGAGPVELVVSGVLVGCPEPDRAVVASSQVHLEVKLQLEGFGFYVF